MRSKNHSFYCLRFEMRARRKEYSAVGLELGVLMSTQVSVETEYVNIGVCV